MKAKAIDRPMIRNLNSSTAMTCYWGVGAVIYALIGWGTWLAASHLKTLSLQNAVQRTMHTSSLFEEHIQRIFTTIYWINEAAVQAWVTHGGQKAKLQADLARIAAKEPFALQVSLVDERGVFIASNVSAEPGADLSDREHIRVHIDRPSSAIYVSKPLIGRVSGKPSINISSTAINPEGTTKLIVVVSFDPERLAEFFRAAELGEGGVVALLRTDGTLLARSSRQETIGENFGAGPAFRALIEAGLPYANFESASPVDGVVRLYTYRLIETLGLVGLVGIDRDEALRDSFLINRVATGWMIALFSGLTGGFLLIHLLRAQEKRAEAAMTARARLEQTVKLISDAFTQAGIEIAIFEPPSSILVASSNVPATEDGTQAEHMLEVLREMSAMPIVDKKHFTRSLATPEGDRRIYSWVVVPASWISETALVCVGFDRTELEEREQALYQRARLTTIGEMLTSLSHEIAQPLTAINFIASTLVESTSAQPDQAASLELLSASVSRVKGIVDRMKMFGRLEPLHEPERFEVLDCLDNVKVLTRNDLDLSAIALDISAEPDLVAIGDPLLFEQVLLNLILNSRDAIVSLGEVDPSRRKIEVRASRSSQAELVILVRDYGAGIPNQLQSRIFDPFFTTKPAGTGLGLALAFGIMRDMDGSINLTTCDIGACFRLTMPAAEEPELAKHAA